MSRVGKQPVAIPTGVTVEMNGREVCVSGPLGRSSWCVPATASVVFDESARLITVTRTDHSKQGRANHGQIRSLIANMVKGVSEGFEKRLLIYGTGYNCKVHNGKLHLNIGFSGRRRGLGDQFELPIPDGLDVDVEAPAARGDSDPARLVIRGYDKQKVGQFAAEVRALRKTEPYKAKGIRYDGEHIRRKQGKALTGSG